MRAATRPHEVGIGSNRRSAGCGEYVLGSCTHRPSSQQSWRRPKSPRKGELSRIQRWGLSRNKVSLAEAGDGSPPFYFIIGIIEKLPTSPQGRMKEFQNKADSTPLRAGYMKQSWLILLFCVHHRSHDSLKVVFLSPFGRQNKISPRGDFLMVSLRSRSDRESLLTINPPK